MGQGDATLIESPLGKKVLVDGGPPSAAGRLLQALRRLGADSLDLVLLTHPHLDHLGGLVQVVQTVPVRLYMDAAFPHPSPAYMDLLRALHDRGIPVRRAEAGRRIDLGDGATLTLLAPPQPFLARTRSDVNANSVVARLDWRQVSGLLMGDAEPETEALLLRQGGPLAAGVLKVPHHGGRFSSTAALLRAVRPEIAVISVGAGNDYGHPTAEVLARLEAAGARIFRTDLHGDITVRSPEGTRWIVSAARPGAPRPAAATPAAAPSPSGPVLGSRRSDVFHRLDCPAVAKIRPANLMRFASREEALAQGRRPAADCHP